MFLLLFWTTILGLCHGSTTLESVGARIYGNNPKVEYTFIVTKIPSWLLRVPSMRNSMSIPILVKEGDDALITCVIRDIGSNTVMWKMDDRERHSMRVLTAGENRVTGDPRFSVLHDSDNISKKKVGGSSEVSSGGDVWVLLIKGAKTTDSGVYICEVNSMPLVRSFHKLSVIPKTTRPPNTTIDSIVSIIEDQTTISSKNHNYTDCCIARNVSTICLGFCNIQSILEGTTGQDPEQCEPDFPSIVYCMADGRNHVPCCIQERVPDICQDVCRGEYTVITENIKTHFSCSSYTEQTLACISEGIELLPSAPEDVEVEPLSETSMKIEWSMPLSNGETITEYEVNVTSLRTFDDEILEPGEDGTKTNSSFMQNIVVKVPADKNMTVLRNLLPFTMYEMKVTANNRHGSSLPSYSVRALTLTPRNPQPIVPGEKPQLPDIKGCCADKGIAHKTCMTKLCDPVKASSMETTDLVICAPWTTDIFGCLTNGLDHTPCCKARGLPDICQQLCTGNVSNIDYNYFKCIRYMGDYTNCLLQGYGVLPSAPTRVHVTDVGTEFAVVRWSPPATLSDTVLYYVVRARVLDDDEGEDGGGEYVGLPRARNPHVLEGLQSDRDYEVYVEAVNEHGVGMPSSRVTFRTKSKFVQEEIEASSTYNVTACCVAAQLNSICLPLCSFDANMTDVRLLAGVCSGEFHKILRCGAAGRSHVTCCSRRGVPVNCQSLCNGVMVDSLAITAATCVPYIGNIAQCFEEGSGRLPGPISALHAVIVDEHTIMLEWNPPENSTNVNGYIVHYQKVDNTSMHETILRLDHQMNTTSTTATITDLSENQMYHIFVVSTNEHGTSLPSSIIVINLVKNDRSKWVNAVTSPPHSLAVASHSATWVTITWQPPEISHPSEHITYRLFHKTASEDHFQVKNTTLISYMLQNLSPNTQYIVYIAAVTDLGVSMPSETLIAWTDPAYPAFVEPPTVHPINLVIEGSSMTILCIAMGTPMPTISLYISGRLVRQDITRHMVTVIHNVTKDMDQISCYADNGYGTPMQASRKIIISHGPHIQASSIMMTVYGDSVTLECKVEAQPEPKMIFWRNHEDRTPVIQGGKYDITTLPVKDEEDKYLMRLTIRRIEDQDVGEYYCHAENAFGSATQPVSVRIRNVAAVSNVTQCCLEQNVTNACMDACSSYLDIDAVIDKPECIADFDKLMKCAADGSDHRSCCSRQNIPRRCLDWCRGEPVLNNKICILSYTKSIMACFHEERDKLPGPPQNLRVDFIDYHSVDIIWDPPNKNAHTVELYRVLITNIDSNARESIKKDTAETQLKIEDLKAGATYQVVVRAGNNRGTSSLTEPLKFSMADEYVTSTASRGEQDGHVGVMVAIIAALVVIVALFVVAVWFVRKRGLWSAKDSDGIAFENPSYLREVNMDHIRVPQMQNDATKQTNAASANPKDPASSSPGEPEWMGENLHVPAQHEVDPTLYEELKLGQNGAGFKRLKP